MGLDKETTEKIMEKRQKRLESIKSGLEEISLKLLDQKHLPLNQRTEISYRAPIDILGTYPGIERQYSEGYIENLAKDIKKHGLINKPLCTLDFEKFPNLNLINIDNINAFILYLVCGNARVQASEKLGKSSIEVLIKYLSPTEVFDISLSENDSRDELNHIDRALLFKNWMSKTGITQQEIANKKEKTQAWVSMTLKLLTLPKKVQELIRKEKVSFYQATKILQIDDSDTQVKLAELCAEGLATRDLESKIEKAKLKALNISPVDSKPDSKIKPPGFLPPISPDRVKPPEKIETKSEVQIALEFVKEALDKAIKATRTVPKEQKIFQATLCTYEVMITRCNGKCPECKYQKGCIEFVKLLRKHWQLVIPDYVELG